MAITLTLISPLSGPPGSTVSCVGTGFDAGTQVACPWLVPTKFVDAQHVSAEIPTELMGPSGRSTTVAIWVRNADGQAAGPLTFTVVYPMEERQGWTSVGAVAGDVPGFQRGGNISDDQVQRWIESTAQTIAATMLHRGLSLDPSDWQQADSTAQPAGTGLLELINRTAAAALLAAAIAGQFSTGTWGFAESLRRTSESQMKALRDGEYDKIFKPAAATLEAGPQLSAGDMADDAGNTERAFSKGQVF